MHGIGTNLGYNNACRTIGHKHRICQRQLTCHTCQKRCRHRITRSRHIKHLDGGSRTVQHLRFVYQAHATFTARNDNIFDVKPAPSLLRHSDNGSVLVSTLTACCLAHFL